MLSITSYHICFNRGISIKRKAQLPALMLQSMVQRLGHCDLEMFYLWAIRDITRADMLQNSQTREHIYPECITDIIRHRRLVVLACLPSAEREHCLPDFAKYSSNISKDGRREEGR